MFQSFECIWTLRWIILQQSLYEIQSIFIRCSREIDLERQRLEMRKLWLFIVWVHCFDLLRCWCPKHLENLSDLLFRAFTWEKGSQFEHLCNYTTCRPYIYFFTILCTSKDEFRCSIISRTNVRD